MSAMNGAAGAHSLMRSLSRDQSVVNHKLKKETFTRILGFSKPYRKWIILLLISLMFDAVVGISSPLLLRSLIDNGILKHKNSLVVLIAVLIAVIAIVDGGITLISRRFSSRIGEGLIFDMRTQIFEHVQKQSIAFFLRTQTGALISRLNSDIVGAQQAFTSILSNLVSNILTLLLVGGTLLTLSWKITLLALALVPIFIIPSRYVGQKVAGLTRTAFATNAEMSSIMTERFNIAGALLVALFGNRIQEKKLFSGKARKVADIGIEVATYNRTFMIALSLVASLATAIAYGFGGHFVITGAITLGTLTALTTLLARIYGPLTSLSSARVDVMTAFVSFERVFEILDLEPMIKNSPDAQEVPEGVLEVGFNEVTFSYPQAHEVSLASLESVAKLDSIPSGEILHGISFTAQPGSVVAIVGPSGAGKSTISSLIPRLYDVRSGSITINGIDIRKFTLESLRGCIGVVTQESHMLHDTIEANLKFAKPDATEEEIWHACEDAQIASLIRSLPTGLQTIIGERGHRLSGGERQRLAIARLLLKDPRIVILDEATAHLDSENEALVHQALSRALVGRTSLVIAHRLSTIVNADNILVLEKGNIVEQGTHAQLVEKRGLYFDLYQRQSLSIA